MTELKTLKDLGNEFISHTGKKTLNRVDVDELKAEAVKWYKFHKDIDGFDVPVKMFIKTFFNLTEDDLK